VPPNEPLPATFQPRHAAPKAPPIDAPSGSRSKTLVNDPGYLDVIDDVVAGELKAPVIEDKHGSHDVLISALAHVTMTVQGQGSVLPLAEGGWYQRVGDTYTVAPGFAAAWRAARG